VFRGFFSQTTEFFAQLARHNSSAWFNKHRSDYERFVLNPAREFVVAMGCRLRQEFPAIVADPRVNGSIFRIFRDVRFSQDKTPYKSHLGVYFWEGRGTRLECSGFYFHLEPPRLMLGGGIYVFPRQLLPAYRRALLDELYGEELAAIVAAIAALPGYEIGGQRYRRTPAGISTDHPQAGLLRHGGLYAGWEAPIPAVLYSAALIDFCWEIFRPLAPLQRWLVSLSAGELP
jgi:uncharacterized protein (TIGR02453 family)